VEPFLGLHCKGRFIAVVFSHFYPCQIFAVLGWAANSRKSLAWQAFIRQGWKRQIAVKDTQAYYDKKLITAIKSFMTYAHVAHFINILNSQLTTLTK
jgi:hypothetical protein